MKCTSEEKIMSARSPNQIFTMNLSTLESEKDEYLEYFKPKAYSTIKNFLVAQKITMLYNEALNQLSGDQGIETSDMYLKLIDSKGNEYEFNCTYISDIKIGNMYVTEENIIFVVESKYSRYYSNYISKLDSVGYMKNSVWEKMKYMIPNVSNHFQTDDGKFAIIVDKPTQIYPLREILNYFGGKLNPEYVASILTRLYYFACCLDVLGLNHNGLTVDNLFFAPGRTVEEGQSFSVDDIRIVGVYGGWFYTTKSENEKIKGIPKEVFEILPEESRKYGYSSYKVDLLSIKAIARELLGGTEDDVFDNILKPLKDWINNPECKSNSYEEYVAWEKVIISSFGKHRFVEMDISIN